MIVFTGGLLLVLGLVSGAFLLLAPFGIGPSSPGVATWILFPGFTIVGFILFAASAKYSIISTASKIGATLLLVLALGAAVALVAVGNGLAHAAGDLLALWYTLGVGLVLGVSGLAIARVSAGAEPAQS
jgi:hypothetical protein